MTVRGQLALLEEGQDFPALTGSLVLIHARASFPLVQHSQSLRWEGLPHCSEHLCRVPLGHAACHAPWRAWYSHHPAGYRTAPWSGWPLGCCSPLGVGGSGTRPAKGRFEMDRWAQSPRRRLGVRALGLALFPVALQVVSAPCGLSFMTQAMPPPAGTSGCLLRRPASIWIPCACFGHLLCPLSRSRRCHPCQFGQPGDTLAFLGQFPILIPKGQWAPGENPCPSISSLRICL